MDPFSAATSWEEVLAANILFLQGKIGVTPYHLGPLTQDFKSEVKALIALHQHNILTFNGQPGLNLPTIKQKPFLSCLLRKSDADLLIDHLHHPNLRFTMSTETKVLATNMPRTCVTKKKETTWRAYTWVPAGHYYDDLEIAFLEKCSDLRCLVVLYDEWESINLPRLLLNQVRQLSTSCCKKAPNYLNIFPN